MVSGNYSSEGKILTVIIDKRRRLTFRFGIMGTIKGEGVVGASRLALYPRNQGSSRGFRLGSIVTVGIPIRPGQQDLS